MLSVYDNLSQFLVQFMKGKLEKIAHNNPTSMVESISQLFRHFQRLVYCYHFITSKINMFCESFHKIKERYQTMVGDRIVGAAPVISAYTLRHFI